ncbi:MAG: hypothetical protein GQ477_03340 [Nanohaloarchaea archaeon]|nr:hypothetical protein [Candidatus Nanohaloarchaea archaeon]
MENLNVFDAKTCDIPEIRELLSMFYRISVSDIDVFFSVCGLSGARVEAISDSMGKDKSTVQRCLNRLYSSGLIKRESKCCIKGKKGRYFIYFAVSNAELKEMLLLHVNNWHSLRFAVIDSLR